MEKRTERLEQQEINKRKGRGSKRKGQRQSDGNAAILSEGNEH